MFSSVFSSQSHYHFISSVSCPWIFSLVFLTSWSCLWLQVICVPPLFFLLSTILLNVVVHLHLLSSSSLCLSFHLIIPQTQNFWLFSHFLLSPCVRCCPPCLSSCCCPVCPSVWSPADRRVWAGCRTAWRTSSTPQCRPSATLCRPGGSAPAASKRQTRGRSTKKYWSNSVSAARFCLYSLQILTEFQENCQKKMQMNACFLSWPISERSSRLPLNHRRRRGRNKITWSKKQNVEWKCRKCDFSDLNCCYLFSCYLNRSFCWIRKQLSSHVRFCENVLRKGVSISH